MQNQPTDDADCLDLTDLIQRRILTLVVEETQRPWTIEEIVRALHNDTHDKTDIEDAIMHLWCVGLLNQASELVFASRAAAHLVSLELFG
jgi:hypothetical protein